MNRLFSRLNHLPRDSRDTLFLLVVIAWILLPQTASLPLWCSALAAGVLVWRAVLAWGSRALPNRWWLAGLLAVTVAATLVTHKTLLGRDAGVTLLVVLLTLKTLELRARRDAFVVFFLGFFCMLSNFFYSQSLLTAASMLIGLLGLITVLVNAHMPVGKPPLLAAAKTAGLMALLGAPIMVVLFVLFPRMAPLWGVPGDAMTGRSGLSPTMQVGTLARLALDDSIALRIKFEGQLPPQSALYFRGPVLSNFDGREWTSAPENPFARASTAATLAVTGEPVRYEVTQEVSNRPWLFVLEATPKAPELVNFQPVMLPDLQWVVLRPISDLVRYKVQSYPSFSYGPLRASAALEEFKTLPRGSNPRTQALAEQIRSDPANPGAGPAEFVALALTRLRTGGYTYTLDPGVYGVNTADEFWFDRKEGFCEHIASSFVILMRALGVPARIVTGYQGGEVNAVDNFWVLRQSDAHAWAEVWLAGRGWVRVDPTGAVAPGRTGSFARLSAPQGVVGQALGALGPGFYAQLRATWDAVNNAWSQWVLNYTQGKQLDLLKNVGFSSPSWEDLAFVLIAIVVAVSSVGAVWTLWERSQHDPWLRLLAQARRRLAKSGLASTSATTPRQLAALATAKFGAHNAASIASWLHALEQQRYAPENAAPKAAPRSALGQLRRQLKTLSWPT